MTKAQAGILASLPEQGRYVFFTLAGAGADLQNSLKKLQTSVDGQQVVAGLGLQVLQQLDKKLPELLVDRDTLWHAVGHDADWDARIAKALNEVRAQARAGKKTLRTHEVTTPPAPTITAAQLLALRERLHLSRPVFAGYLRTNPRTLENWEQGRAKPNAQAALIMRLVEKYPDTVKRLAAV